jgi:uncharacterized protein (TIGR02598 family)
MGKVERLTPSRGTRAGFSLVETAMAVGILSFALITIIGLQPVGLTTLRSSMDSTTETQIIRQIAGEIGQTDFARIDAYEGTPLYFDADGKRVSDSAVSRYQLEAKVVEASSDFSPFPSAPADIGSSLKTVRLAITLLPAGTPGRVHTFHVARSDQLQ